MDSKQELEKARELLKAADVALSQIIHLQPDSFIYGTAQSWRNKYKEFLNDFPVQRQKR